MLCLCKQKKCVFTQVIQKAERELREKKTPAIGLFSVSTLQLILSSESFNISVQNAIKIVKPWHSLWVKLLNSWTKMHWSHPCHQSCHRSHVSSKTFNSFFKFSTENFLEEKSQPSASFYDCISARDFFLSYLEIWKSKESA